MGEVYDVCMHLALPWSDYWCPDSNTNFRPFDTTTIVTLTFTRAGVTHITPIDPRADVIYLTGMAVDSVLAGYYAGKALSDKASDAKLKALRARADRLKAK